MQNLNESILNTLSVIIGIPFSAILSFFFGSYYFYYFLHIFYSFKDVPNWIFILANVITYLAIVGTLAVILYRKTIFKVLALTFGIISSLTGVFIFQMMMGA